MTSSSPRLSLPDRQALIEQHLGYVRAMAIAILRTLPSHVDLDELVACGNIGLVEAAERFDPRHRANFRTFAYYRIRGAIYDALRKMGPLSRADYTRARFAANANDLLQTMADDESAQREAALASVDDEISAAQAALEALIPAYLMSLNTDSVVEVADQSPSALEQVEHEELITFTRAMLDELSEDDRQIIQMIYYQDLNISEVGIQLNVSKSWASRLHTKAIKHLREIMQRHGLVKGD